MLSGELIVGQLFSLELGMRSEELDALCVIARRNDEANRRFNVVNPGIQCGVRSVELGVMNEE